MTESPHQCTVGLYVTPAASVGFKPFPKDGVEGFMLGLGDLAGLFDQVGVGAEGDISHEDSVHDFRVISQGNLGHSGMARDEFA